MIQNFETSPAYEDLQARVRSLHAALPTACTALPHASLLAMIEQIEVIGMGDADAYTGFEMEHLAQDSTVRKVRDAYEYACTAVEDLDDYNHDQSLDILTKLEMIAARMNTTSNVAFVGCGSVPESAMAYAQIAGHVTDIECRPRAVRLAQAVVDERSGYLGGAEIKIAQAYGETYDNYADFSHIIVATMVRNKTNVLRQIARTASPDAIIIARSVDGLRTLLHEPLAAIPPELALQATVYGPPETSVNHFMLLQFSEHSRK